MSSNFLLLRVTPISPGSDFRAAAAVFRAAVGCEQIYGGFRGAQPNQSRNPLPPWDLNGTFRQRVILGTNPDNAGTWWGALDSRRGARL